MSDLSQLRIVIRRGDQYHHHGVALDLFERARKSGLAGATMLEVVEGLGGSHRAHLARRWSTTDAVAYELLIVDTEERISAFLTSVRGEMGDRGLVSRQAVTMVTGRIDAGR